MECNPSNTLEETSFRWIEAIKSRGEQVAFEIEEQFRGRTKGKADV